MSLVVDLDLELSGGNPKLRVFKFFITSVLYAYESVHVTTVFFFIIKQSLLSAYASSFVLWPVPMSKYTKKCRTLLSRSLTLKRN